MKEASGWWCVFRGCLPGSRVEIVGAMRPAPAKDLIAIINSKK
jgi:hypothetical protein